MIQQYIEYVYPGIIVSESSFKRVDRRDPPKELPEGCFGYRFCERQETVVEGEVLNGKFRNESPWTYVGYVKTNEEVQSTMAGSVLASNMRGNKIEKVCMTKFGQAIPLEKGDKVVEV